MARFCALVLVLQWYGFVNLFGFLLYMQGNFIREFGFIFEIVDTFVSTCGARV